MNIPFSPPDISQLEKQYVMEALESGWITTGPKTKQFERELAQASGTARAICMNSATAAMEMVLRALEVGPGDEVIVPAYTYSATAAVVAHVGATIVMADVKPGTYEMDPEGLKQALTARTKVVMPVDIGGLLCDYPALFAVLEEKKHLYTPKSELQRLFDRVIMLADAAHSFGSSQGGRMCGSIADFTCFSFHAVKNLTSAEGGAATWRDIKGLSDEDLYQRLQLLSLHGQNKDALSKMKLGAWEYDILFPGYKCNMTDLQAGLGLAQLHRFSEMTGKRLKTIQAFDQAFLPLGLRSLNHFGPDFYSNGHLYLVRIPGIGEDQRNRLIERMAERGIACNVHFKPLPLLTAYKNLGFDIKDYPQAYRMFENVITLPTHPLMTASQVDYVIAHFSALAQEAMAANPA